MTRARELAMLCPVAWALACGASEPDEGLRARLARERQEEIAKEVERRVQLEKEKLEAELEARKRSGLVLDLPQGTAMELDVTRVSLVIMVPVSGDVVINGRTVPDAELATILRAAFVRDKDTQVILQADKGAAHGRVVGIMEQAKAAGLTRLAIGTTR